MIIKKKIQIKMYIFNPSSYRKDYGKTKFYVHSPQHKLHMQSKHFGIFRLEIVQKIRILPSNQQVNLLSIHSRLSLTYCLQI